MTTSVICCAGAAPASTRRDAVVLEVDDHNLRIQALSDALPATIPSRAQDLVAIAGYAYWADQMVSRGGDTDVFGDRWLRSFELWVPVLDRKFWMQDEIKEALQETLNYVTGDSWRFFFAEKSSGEVQLELPNMPGRTNSEIDCVALLSGGADSLSAVVQAVRAHGLHPLLVSHSSNGRTERRQRGLVEALGHLVQQWSFPQLALTVNKRKEREKESTQRTRGFLYASLGAASAAAIHQSDVLMSDNGPVSVGLPISGQVIGSMASRTTHPQFLFRMNKLLTWVTPGVRLRNPLWSMTRGEALAVLRTHHVEELLRRTNSCSAGRLLPDETPHCGKCSQCLDRRIGVVSQHLESFDSKYQVDTFREPLAGLALSLGESLIRHACKVAELTPERVVVEFTQLFECVTGAEPMVESYLEGLAEMLIRQARTTQLALAVEHDRSFESAAPSSLLGLWGGRDAVGEGGTARFVSISTVNALNRATQTRSVKPRLPERRSVAYTNPATEADFRRYRFRSRLPIEISGQDGTRIVVLVDGTEARLTEMEFVLFLRLVVALFERADGYEPLGDEGSDGLALEEWFDGQSMEGLANRVRDRFRPFLGTVKHTDFIQVVNRRVRLSTHSNLILFDRSWLMNHSNRWVKEFAKRLPDCD